MIVPFNTIIQTEILCACECLNVNTKIKNVGKTKESILKVLIHRKMVSHLNIKERDEIYRNSEKITSQKINSI